MTTPKCRHFHCKVYLVSQIAFRQLKEYRKPIVRKTLEIYGVDEGSRTPTRTRQTPTNKGFKIFRYANRSRTSILLWG
jgi:hypothetical protein